jgi:predicted SAM-dependent methyltransferase
MSSTGRVRQVLKRSRLLVGLSRTVRRARSGARSLRRRALLDPPAIRRYLEEHPVRKLQIGAGPNPLPGWLNTDVVPDTWAKRRHDLVFLDATRPFPFDDMTFDYVFAEHMIEHVSEADARAMIAESFRVLRPGGRIRIATPNLAAIVGLYRESLSELEQHYVDWVMSRFRPDIRSGDPRCYVINQMFNAYGHRFIYDQPTLASMLTDAGLVDVVGHEPGQSDDPVLMGVESHGGSLGDIGDGVFAPDEDVNRFETMVLEATRPLARAGDRGATPSGTSPDPSTGS